MVEQILAKWLLKDDEPTIWLFMASPVIILWLVYWLHYLLRYYLG